MKRAIQKKGQRASEGMGDRPNPSERTHLPSFAFGVENFSSVAGLAKGLSDENRLRILLCLSSKKKAVSSIVDEVGLSQPLVSHHLKELKRYLLVTVERNGPFIYYGLSDPRTLDILQTLSSMAADLVAARKTL
jgi:DNA-binding transcriptional ArsR family regulator